MHRASLGQELGEGWALHHLEYGGFEKGSMGSAPRATRLQPPSQRWQRSVFTGPAFARR
jgi:hypothetical protein